MASETVTPGGSYIPGVCNINTVEVHRRRMIGHAGAVVYVVALALLAGLSANRLYRLALFLPAFMGASGYLQARNHFCSGYGSRSLQNATEGSTKAAAVNDAEATSKDRRKARQINLQAALIAVALTAVAMLIP